MQATLIFPHQLFKTHPAVSKEHLIILVEDPRFFSDFAFHKQKLILHRASMQRYYHELKKKKHTVVYVEYSDARSLATLLKKKKVTELHYADVVDHALEQKLTKLCKQLKLDCSVYETPYFMTERDWFEQYFTKKKTYFFHSFYIAQRKRLKILVNNGKPVGGSWSFDDQNREPLQSTVTIPSIKTLATNAYITEAVVYVQKNFANNPGEIETFIYPVTRTQALAWLTDFLQKRFKNFGPYQDAIAQGKPFLFHSILSSSLNIGLLTPDEVVEKALVYAKKYKVPINSVEGFVRQVIGWREFIYGVYLVAGTAQGKKNFFRHTKKMPRSCWHATTEIEPIDATISSVLTYAYAHHIERLMILGNFFLLVRISPHEVYAWFMELFIDAYDWVMVPNVYGMSQYADGGLMTTKPYVSGSNYVRTMSDYQKGEWADVWDALFWSFMDKYKKQLAKNNRLRFVYAHLRKMTPEKKRAYKAAANKFIKSL